LTKQTSAAFLALHNTSSSRIYALQEMYICHKHIYSDNRKRYFSFLFLEVL